MEETGKYTRLVEQANAIRKQLDEKPASMKIGYIRVPGGILNAYREGDINFEEAKTALHKWAVETWKGTKPPNKIVNIIANIGAASGIGVTIAVMITALWTSNAPLLVKIIATSMTFALVCCGLGILSTE